jgi:hypothetical protein
MVTILVGEDYSPLTLNLGDGSIAKTDSATNLQIELDEEMLDAGHMVCGPRVKDLAPVVVLLRWPEIGKHSLFFDVDRPVRWSRWRFKFCFPGVEDDTVG